MKIVKYVLVAFALVLAGAVLLFFPDGASGPVVDVPDGADVDNGDEPVKKEENESEVIE